MLSTKKWADLVAPIKNDPVRGPKIRAGVRAVKDVQRLAEMREAAGLSQEDFARKLDMSEADAATLEQAEDVYLTTLRDYIRDMGGELEVKATFPDGQEIKIA